jgi:hypothetical protein
VTELVQLPWPAGHVGGGPLEALGGAPIGEPGPARVRELWGPGRTQVGVSRRTCVAGDGSAPGRLVEIEWHDSTAGTRPVTSDELSDIQLWDLAVDGDPKSFGVLFERHARSVYNHCFRRTAS